MMIKQLSRHGNSKAITIDKALLELLNIDEDTLLEITTDGVSLILTPVNEPDKSRLLERFLAGSERFAERHPKVQQQLTNKPATSRKLPANRSKR